MYDVGNENVAKIAVVMTSATSCYRVRLMKTWRIGLMLFATSCAPTSITAAQWNGECATARSGAHGTPGEGVICDPTFAYGDTHGLICAPSPEAGDHVTLWVRQCTTNESCGSGYHCRNSAYCERECTSNGGCGEWQTCSGGACVAVACH